MDVQTQEKASLGAVPREATGKGVSRRLRAAGQVPAVCYGVGQEPVTLAVDPTEVVSIFATPRGKDILFDLQVEGAETIANVMVKDYQVDPVRRELLHVDLLVVDMEEPVRAAVPIKPVGVSRGVRQGGILNIVRPEIDILARPTEIPDFIEVDVTELEPGQTIQAEDVVLPGGVGPAWKANYGLMRVIMPRKKAVVKKDDDKKKKK